MLTYHAVFHRFINYRFRNETFKENLRTGGMLLFFIMRYYGQKFHIARIYKQFRSALQYLAFTKFSSLIKREKASGDEIPTNVLDSRKKVGSIFRK